MIGLMQPGFVEPVRDSQAVFRAILDAMARPGSIHTVTAPAEPPPPLGRASAAVLLTLVDGETSLWMDDRTAAASEWAIFHCGARLVPAADALFAVAIDALLLTDFCCGTDEEPESSATLVLQVAGLGEGSAFRLEGPGLAVPKTLAVDGLSDGFPAELSANRNLLPRGIDVILCAGDRLAALPRTVQFERA